MLDLRQLRYFVTVAEQEHVGRAAERLNISQSPLSRQIKQLETTLGLALFERAKQRIHLTPQGRDFLIDARALLSRADAVEQQGRRLGRGDAGRMAIGYVEGAVHAGLVASTLRQFRKGRDGLQLQLRSLRSAQQIEALRQQDLDIGLVYTPPVPGSDIASKLIMSEPLILAIPRHDALARQRKISPQDLDGRTWITVVRPAPDTVRESFLAACIKAGFTPNGAYETADPLTSLGLVSAGLGLATVQSSLRRQAPTGIVFRDLPWFRRSIYLHLAWRRSDRRPLISAFREAALASSDPRLSGLGRDR